MIQGTSPGLEARIGVDITESPTDPPSWKQLMAGAIREPIQLLEALNLDPARWGIGARRGHQLFPVFVPSPFMARIEPGNPQDPLLSQILPVEAETRTPPGFSQDPLEEASATAAPGLIRKYRSRALVVLAGACAINCRYCFRRQFPYGEHRLGADERQQVLAFLKRETAINEVIFSGGDPLVIGDRALEKWVKAIESVDSLRRLRIHTRLPVVIPQRVTDTLAGMLSRSRLQTVMVMHINHPNEIDPTVIAACLKLKRAGVTLLNQSVLLGGVNDRASTLSALSERLFEAGVLPYYLHTLDPVAGAAHFMVDEDQARALMADLLTSLPGFLVPRLVREIPGRASKTPLDLRLE